MLTNQTYDPGSKLVALFTIAVALCTIGDCDSGSWKVQEASSVVRSHD